MKPTLIISILFRNKGAIGGMAQRFSFLASEMIVRGWKLELLTTRSLCENLSLPISEKHHVIDDSRNRLQLDSILMILKIFSKIGLGYYRHVHLAGAGRLALTFIRICKFSHTKVTCTFASRTLEMASYGQLKERIKWSKILDSVDGIDVLNPGHNLFRWAEKISVSPCSFLSRREILTSPFPKKKLNICVFVGALEPTKNPLLAINIFSAYAARSDEDVRMIIVGKGKLESDVRCLITATNSRLGRDAVTIKNESSLISVLQVANVFFSLQEEDNYPSQALMEAMLLGCKIISTDEGDTHLIIPASEPLNSRINSRDPLDFLTAMNHAFSDFKPSETNSSFIRQYHTVERFIFSFSKFIDYER